MQWCTINTIKKGKKGKQHAYAVCDATQRRKGAAVWVGKRGSGEEGESNKNRQVGNIDDAIEEQQQNSELFTSVDHVNK